MLSGRYDYRLTCAVKGFWGIWAHVIDFAVLNYRERTIVNGRNWICLVSRFGGSGLD